MREPLNKGDQTVSLCEYCSDLHFELPTIITRPVNAAMPLSWHEAAESGFSAALFFGIDA